LFEIDPFSPDAVVGLSFADDNDSPAFFDMLAVPFTVLSVRGGVDASTVHHEPKDRTRTVERRHGTVQLDSFTRRRAGRWWRG
jgi:hypothetical protein